MARVVTDWQTIDDARRMNWTPTMDQSLEDLEELGRVFSFQKKEWSNEQQTNWLQNVLYLLTRIYGQELVNSIEDPRDSFQFSLASKEYDIHTRSEPVSIIESSAQAAGRTPRQEREWVQKEARNRLLAEKMNQEDRVIASYQEKIQQEKSTNDEMEKKALESGEMEKKAVKTPRELDLLSGRVAHSSDPERSPPSYIPIPSQPITTQDERRLQCLTNIQNRSLSRRSPLEKGDRDLFQTVLDYLGISSTITLSQLSTTLWNRVRHYRNDLAYIVRRVNTSLQWIPESEQTVSESVSLIMGVYHEQAQVQIQTLLKHWDDPRHVFLNDEDKHIVDHLRVAGRASPFQTQKDHVRLERSRVYRVLYRNFPEIRQLGFGEYWSTPTSRDVLIQTGAHILRFYNPKPFMNNILFRNLLPFVANRLIHPSHLLVRNAAGAVVLDPRLTGSSLTPLRVQEIVSFISSPSWVEYVAFSSGVTHERFQKPVMTIDYVMVTMMYPWIVYVLPVLCFPQEGDVSRRLAWTENVRLLVQSGIKADYIVEPSLIRTILLLFQVGIDGQTSKILARVFLMARDKSLPSSLEWITQLGKHLATILAMDPTPFVVRIVAEPSIVQSVQKWDRLDINLSNVVPVGNSHVPREYYHETREELFLTNQYSLPKSSFLVGKSLGHWFDLVHQSCREDHTFYLEQKEGAIEVSITVQRWIRYSLEEFIEHRLRKLLFSNSETNVAELWFHKDVRRFLAEKLDLDFMAGVDYLTQCRLAPYIILTYRDPKLWQDLWDTYSHEPLSEDDVRRQVHAWPTLPSFCILAFCMNGDWRRIMSHVRSAESWTIPSHSSELFQFPIEKWKDWHHVSDKAEASMHDVMDLFQCNQSQALSWMFTYTSDFDFASDATVHQIVHLLAIQFPSITITHFPLPSNEIVGRTLAIWKSTDVDVIQHALSCWGNYPKTISDYVLVPKDGLRDPCHQWLAYCSRYHWIFKNHDPTSQIRLIHNHTSVIDQFRAECEKTENKNIDSDLIRAYCGFEDDFILISNGFNDMSDDWKIGLLVLISVLTKLNKSTIPISKGSVCSQMVQQYKSNRLIPTMMQLLQSYLDRMLYNS